MLHNLDNDRIVGKGYVEHVLKMFDADDRRIVHASVPMDASSYAAIGCSAVCFADIGGYDESLPYPSGCQDTDLIKRLQGVGYSLVRVASESLAGFGISNDQVVNSNWRARLKAKAGCSSVVAGRECGREGGSTRVMENRPAKFADGC